MSEINKDPKVIVFAWFNAVARVTIGLAMTVGVVALFHLIGNTIGASAEGFAARAGLFAANMIGVWLGVLVMGWAIGVSYSQIRDPENEMDVKAFFPSLKTPDDRIAEARTKMTEKTATTLVAETLTGKDAIAELSGQIARCDDAEMTQTLTKQLRLILADEAKTEKIKSNIKRKKARETSESVEAAA